MTFACRRHQRPAHVTWRSRRNEKQTHSIILWSHAHVPVLVNQPLHPLRVFLGAPAPHIPTHPSLGRPPTVCEAALASCKGRSMLCVTVGGRPCPAVSRCADLVPTALSPPRGRCSSHLLMDGLPPNSCPSSSLSLCRNDRAVGGWLPCCRRGSASG